MEIYCLHNISKWITFASNKIKLHKDSDFVGKLKAKQIKSKALWQLSTFTRQWIPRAMRP